MNMLQTRWRPIVLVAVVVVVVILGVLLFSHKNAVPSENVQNATSTGNISSTVTTVTNGTPSSDGSATASAAPRAPRSDDGNIPLLPGPAITINLITPISGNAWTMGGANPIAWDTPAGITGEIELVNANTKAFIGVILSETGANQTSYSWDARSIFLTRYGADKKDVIPGTYSIRIHFDGNGLGDLVSGPITITN